MAAADSLRAALARAAKTRDKAERHIAVAAVIAQALEPLGQDPIVVGGAAVEFYTRGGYTTADLDLVAPGGPEVRVALRALGFRTVGKDFIHDALALYIEFPSRALGPNERTQRVVVGARAVRIVSREDLIVDRLCAFKFWRSALDGVSALLLLESAELDETRLLARAREADVGDALAAVRDAGTQIIRRRLSKKRANALLEERMRSLTPKSS